MANKKAISKRFLGGLKKNVRIEIIELITEAHIYYERGYL